MDYKDRTKKALEGYFKKLEVQNEPMLAKRKNQAPEKAVQDEVLDWCKSKNFCVDVIEAKAVYSKASGMYTGRAASPGISDIVGNTPTGLGVFLELKSKGRRVGSALRPKQRDFLIKKIKSCAFAAMVDSSNYLDKIWTQFCSLPTTEQRIAFLLSEIPDHKHRGQESLFD